MLVDERRRTAQGHELTVATHVLGPLLLTGLLAPELRAAVPSRVVFVSSGGMYTARVRPDDLELEREEFDGPRFYAHAKRLQVIVAEQLAERWRAEGIAVYSMHPGWVRTGGLDEALPRFTRLARPLLRDPQQGADTAVWLLAAPEAPSGPSGFWHDRQAAASAPPAANPRDRVGAAGGLGRARSAQRLRRSGGRARPAAGERPMSRIAVVGAGISGLVAARELDLAGHDVVVFEADARPAGTPTRCRSRPRAGTWNVDIGFIVFNDRNYPNFERLLDELGVASQPAEMSLSVADGRGGFEWSSNARGVFARPAHIADPRFHRMIADLARFFREARGLLGADGSGPSLGEFLDRGGYSRWFVERLLIPQVSAVWSADPDELGDFPAVFLAEFLFEPRRAAVPRPSAVAQHRRRLTGRTSSGSSRPSAIGCGCAPGCGRSAAAPAGVEVVTRDGHEHFDEVVLALHSDQALAMLADPSRRGARGARRDPVRAQRGRPAHGRVACCRAGGGRGRRGTAIWSRRPSGGRRSPTT